MKTRNTVATWLGATYVIISLTCVSLSYYAMIPQFIITAGLYGYVLILLWIKLKQFDSDSFKDEINSIKN